MLLKAAEGWEDHIIAAALSVGRATVERLRQRFVEEGLGALEERPRPGTAPKLDGKAEARLIAEACSDAPEGRSRPHPAPAGRSCRHLVWPSRIHMKVSDGS